MKVLIVGNGAREHTIAEAVAASRRQPEIYSFMAARNPGIARLSDRMMIAPLDDFEKLEKFVRETKPELAIIGPEAPLSKGIVDFLETLNVPSVGPKKVLAQLETSKSFARELMPKYDIPGCPKFKVFRSMEGIGNFLDELGQSVIKPDGLTGGKGVMVQGDHYSTREEALAICQDVLKRHSAVIVEEKLEGEEFSLQSMTDGQTVIDFPPAQDHKRAYEGDTGPNTGGMGSYSCEDHKLPFLTEQDIRDAHEITEKFATALYAETGELYKGVMYGGFIVTKDGVKLIEYNARFGDPEAMNVLPLLKTDFLDICKAIIAQTLDTMQPEFMQKATVCKYIVPEGYPDNPISGKEISLTQAPAGVRTYYASVDERDGKVFMSKSRAIAFVGIADNLAAAEELAESAVQTIKGPVFHRKDIGTQELLKKRVDHMNSVRKS